MSKKRYACAAVIAACLCCSRVAVAADEPLGLAASDPQRIAGLVGQMDAKEVPAFAGRVMQAVAKMPTSPKHRLRQLNEAAVEFARAAAPAEQPALLARLVMNTPFQMLPGWVEAFKPPLAEQLKPVDDAAYDKLAAAVLKEIEGAEALTDEDKTIFTTFAIVLLARGKDPDESLAFANRLFPLLPGAYRDQVAAATPAALAGDYTLVLGPDAGRMRLVIPEAKQGERPVNLAEVLGGVATQPDLLVHDVNRPAPLIRTDLGDPTPAPPTTTPKPVIPEPYKAQF
jgi:hypothetical protein